LLAVGDNGSCVTWRASSIGTITDTIAEVLVGTKARGFWCRASEGWGEGEHVGDTCFTTGWEVGWELRSGKGSKRAEGDDGGSHVDGCRGELEELFEGGLMEMGDDVEWKIMRCGGKCRGKKSFLSWGWGS